MPGTVPDPNGTWRFGSLVESRLGAEAFDADGRLRIDFTEGVEDFKNPILFMAGEHQRVIGEEYQRRQMALFNSTSLVVIPDAGHEMFAENPEASIKVVREYLNGTSGI